MTPRHLRAHHRAPELARGSFSRRATSKPHCWCDAPFPAGLVTCHSFELEIYITSLSFTSICSLRDYAVAVRHGAVHEAADSFGVSKRSLSLFRRPPWAKLRRAPRPAPPPKLPNSKLQKTKSAPSAARILLPQAWDGILTCTSDRRIPNPTMASTSSTRYGRCEAASRGGRSRPASLCPGERTSGLARRSASNRA